MVSLKKLKELVLLVDSDMDLDSISKILSINPKNIKNLYKKGKQIFKNDSSRDVDEQIGDTTSDSSNSTTSSSTTGGQSTTPPSQPTSTKWETGVGRGKANPIDSKSKWESGVTRGKANPLN